MIRAVAIVVVGLALVLPGRVEGAPPDGENGRFTFLEVAEGLLRLDSRTGQVSLCTWRVAGWACRAVPDDRSTLESEIARLQGEVAALKKELAARAAPPPSASAAPPKAEPPKVEPPKVEPPRAEPPRTASPPAEPPRAEAPTTEPPGAVPPTGRPDSVSRPPGDDEANRPVGFMEKVWRRLIGMVQSIQRDIDRKG